MIDLHKKYHGVAMIIVIVSLALMVSIVTEVSSEQYVRYKLALAEVKAVQAEALAQSGVNFATIILLFNDTFEYYLSNAAKMGIELPAYTVWELMPIDSSLLKGIFAGSYFPSFSGQDSNKESNDKVDHHNQENKFFGPYVAPSGGFGGFLGDFSVEISDEESKISIRKWSSFPPAQQKMIADQIYYILAKPENNILFDGSISDNIIGVGRLIGNIYDYISKEDRAIDIKASKERFGLEFAGDKRNQYVNMPLIAPKKAPMDSLTELRLVPGMNDAIFKELADHITIYGEGGKINIISAKDSVMEALFYSCAKDTSLFNQPNFAKELAQKWMSKKKSGQISFEALVGMLEESGVSVDKENCEKAVGLNSKSFAIVSEGRIGLVTKTIYVQLRVVSGLVTLYQYQSL